MREDVVYRIKNKDGLYSSGGQNPRFSKNSGKVWTSLGRLKNHLRQFCPKPKKTKFNNNPYDLQYEAHEVTKNKIPSDWIIVEYSPNGKEINAKELFGYET